LNKEKVVIHFVGVFQFEEARLISNNGQCFTCR